MDSAAALTNYQVAVDTVMAEMQVYYTVTTAGLPNQVGAVELSRWLTMLKAARGENP